MIAVQPHGGENLEVMREATNYNDWLRRLVREIGGDCRAAVDFGAGIGTFSDSLSLPASSIHCVEPSAASREVLRQKGFQAYADIGDLEDDSAPYVFSLNVLEHIEDDAAALRAIHRKLVPGGVLFVYVPAFEALFTSMDSHVGHCRRYRRPQLVRQVADAGFDVLYSAYADFLGFFATLAMRLVDKPEPAPLNPRLVRLYDRWVFPASRVLSTPFSRVCGKNVYVIASKPSGGAG